jgi:hypothetical protein
MQAGYLGSLSISREPRNIAHFSKKAACRVSRRVLSQAKRLEE